MDTMFTEVLNHINFIYIFLCNIISYIIITCIPKDLSTGWKRLISTIVAGIAGVLFIMVWHESKEIIFCSFFVQYLMYDYVIKTFFKKFTNDSGNDVDKETKKSDDSGEDMIII